MKPLTPSLLILHLLLYLLLHNQHLSHAIDTITPNRSSKDGETIISSGRTFELGFFSHGNTTKRYVGIWYYEGLIPVKTVVWVANREASVDDKFGEVKLSNSGNLVVTNATNHSIWSSNTSRTVRNPIAQLSDSGNLVIRDEDDNNPEDFLWQSFDHPTDTLIKGMKIGKNFITGQEIYLSSWKSEDDPSPGDYTYHCDPTGYPQLLIKKTSSTDKVFRSGPWNGVRFNAMPNTRANNIFTYKLIFNERELYYEITDSSVISRTVLRSTGVQQRSTWLDRTKEWVVYLTAPIDICDIYALCGAHGTCNGRNSPVCDCLEKFVPRDEIEWNRTDWSNGCIRRTTLDCEKGDGFIKHSNIKPPDMRDTWYNVSMSLKDCGTLSLKNCTCMAYASLDIRGSGCLLWFGNLTDIRELSEGGQDLYVRMAASELDQNSKEKRQVEIIVISIVAGMLLFGFLTWYVIWRRKQQRGAEKNEEDMELPLFDMATITAATKNFCRTNMLGKGGFGHVYKGTLPTGQEIAAKRLSKNSGQGIKEFKNEILLISRLQHRNLVKLLGCCFEGEERMLIYEYMPNKSLDNFIFDHDRRSFLTWEKRFEISLGIAKGLMYLHQDSRLRIVHRDLKASNVLLDNDLNPKISDFGIARTFVGDQIEAKTRHVIGTYGYMSPEYAIDGKFSVKSDVFSFSVLLLEIVSGKKNSGFHHPDHHHSLLDMYVITYSPPLALFCMVVVERRARIGNSGFVLRGDMQCIQVGLLCVQKLPMDRPTMSSVVIMLGSEDVVLPWPKEPGFFTERSSEVETDVVDENGMTITTLEAR